VPDLQLFNVVKRFGQTEVIHGVDLEVEHGEFVVFVGPSGCGKSTLLRMIAGLEEISDGDIVIDGNLVNEVDASQRGLAMVFQSYALYPHMTVRKNLAFGLETVRTPKPIIQERVAEAARILKLDALLDRRPSQLSGGQRQRVAIGRAIVREPKIFLFDEPLSNLDAELRVQMRVEIAKLHKRLGATMIYVTHDQVEAMTMADRIVVLRSGYIEQVGTPLELYNHPTNQFVAGFIGSPRMNFLQAKVRAVGEQGLEIELGEGTVLHLPRTADHLRPGAPVTVGIRPVHLRVDAGEGEVIPAVVNLSEHLGGETFFYATLATDESLTIAVPGQAFLDVGVTVPVRVDPELCHLFDADGRAVPLAPSRAKAA
jgi:ABC-type sugar transport system ATPase subunit